MKRKNPYILVAIIWAVLTVIFVVASVVLFVDGRLAVGALLVCVACGFAFATGGLCEKARAIAEFNAQCKWLHEMAEVFNEAVKELGKAEENRPFKEFDTASEVPFPEVKNKENLR